VVQVLITCTHFKKMKKNIMKIVNLSSKALLFLGVAYMGFSCKKVDTPKAMGDAGQTVVKLITDDGLFRLRAINLVNTPQVIEVLDIRRDISNNVELNKTMTIIMQEDQTLVDDYNDENGTSYVALPSDKYTVDAANPKTGTDWTVTMSAKEFAKPLKITVPNSLALDLSQTYAFGFRIKTVDQNGKISADAQTAVVEIGVKNNYDGKYKLNGAFYHPVSSPAYSTFTVDVEMHTTGANSVKIYYPDFGGYYHPKYNNGTIDAFGAQEPDYTIDPATNKVTVQNSFVGAVTFYQMNPTFDSRYDPATKTIYAKFGYNYSAGPVFNPAANREWMDQLVYVGPR
jgi:flagellin-like hook-associated protein FlgL